MGYRELRGVDGLAGYPEQIEIKGSGSPRNRSLTTGELFEPLQFDQERVSVELRRKTYRAIQIIGLRRTAYGRIFV